MTTKRRKAEAAKVPADRQEAEQLLRQFAALDEAAEANDRWLHETCTRAKDAHRIEADRLKAEMKEIFNRLKPWWAVVGPEIAGKRRSAELGGCEIGHRLGQPELVLPKDRDEAELIGHLDLLGFEEWAIRVKREINKAAILAALRAPIADERDAADAQALTGLGFAWRQVESFFIARCKPQAPAVEEIPADAPAPVAGLEGGAA
jgi:phage host-nuclease inhibitor protein Gam